jgi:hypothetical protein
LDAQFGKNYLPFKRRKKNLRPLKYPQHNLPPVQKELQMLDSLSTKQVESALSWLDSPIKSPPPEELKGLLPMEWYLLERMLEALQKEQELSPLH